MSEPVVAFILFVVGFVILVKGAQILVRGASSVAKLFHVSNWFVGIVIVGIGTSIPEFSINIAAALKGSSIGLSAIIGSNTFNILGILGISALCTPFVFRRQWVQDVYLNVSAVMGAAVMILFSVTGPHGFLGISRDEGLILFLFFLVWISFMLRRDEEDADGADYEIFTIFTSILMIAAGIIGVYFGGTWVVDGARAIALTLGVSPALVGLTVVAVGTSMPELTVSLVAAMRGSSGIAVGNVIGSNIFDFIGILGITALIHPIAVEGSVQFDILATLIAAVTLFLAVLIGKKYHITRTKGLVFVGLYLLYLTIVLLRG